jgi:hypothetical protein
MSQIRTLKHSPGTRTGLFSLNFAGCRLHGGYPETGFEEISGDVLEQDFWPAGMSCPNHDSSE